jgi:hypothetical protein
VIDGELGKLLRRFRRLGEEQHLAGATDGELLGRFTADRDEAAKAALFRRHAPMVLAACRRVLRWEEAKRKLSRPKDDSHEEVISVSVDKERLACTDALAKKMKISRACLSSRGLKAVLAAEGQF